jgi:hypothetical protein
MPASRSFFRWWDTVGGESSEKRDQLAYADLARVLAKHVHELHPDRVAERLRDVRHSLGLSPLDVRIDDRLAAALAGGMLLP